MKTLKQWILNFYFRLRWPVYYRCGGRLITLTSDFRYAKIKLPLYYRTRNYVGTLYGGSMFAVVDPIYMIMLINNLGRKYIVWDKSARIDFLLPGDTDLFAEFHLDQDQIESIKQECNQTGKSLVHFKIPLTDKNGKDYAVVFQEIHIRKK